MMTTTNGKQGKFQMVLMEDLVADDHFLRQLDSSVDFRFIYDIVKPLYSDKGRPSIDPVLLVKMLLIGYIYGIDSERKLCEAIHYNIAYRWFLGLNLDEKVARSFHVFAKQTAQIFRHGNIQKDI